jgi:hypothetical protein
MNEVAPIAPSTTLIDLLRVAVDKGAEIATLERLAKLYEAAELAQKKAEFNNALAAAKAELRPIVKDQEIVLSSGKSIRTESMAAISEVIDPILARHGLFAIFPDPDEKIVKEPNRIYVTCRLAHRNGYAIEKTRDGPPDAGMNRNPMQAIGSSITYLQRYTLKEILGLAVTKEGKPRVTDRPEQIGAPAAPKPDHIIESSKPEAIPRGDSEWQDWSRSLLMMINAARTDKLVEQWVRKNAEPLATLEAEIPAHHAFVQREINKRLRKLRGSSAA